MALFAVPFQWNELSYQNIISNKNGENGSIVEVYGIISEGRLPHGRTSESVRKIGKEEALLFKKKLDENNLKFTYLLNASIYDLNKTKVREEIDWIINTFKPYSINIASFELMQYIRRNYGQVRINISTIAGIKQVEQLKEYDSLGISKVVLHHDGNRNIEELKRFLQYAEAHAIDIELMVNESCLFQCPKRAYHYMEIAKGNTDEKFHHWCNSSKLTNPNLLLMANYILPQDIAYYEALGVKYFKITGRTKKVDWLNTVMGAYIRGNSVENLMNLLAIDPNLNADGMIYINVQKLDGFFQLLLETSNISDRIYMCKKKILELYENNDFRVDANVEYFVENNQLKGNIKGDIYGICE